MTASANAKQPRLKNADSFMPAAFWALPDRRQTLFS
jgi:hypothetical protein